MTGRLLTCREVAEWLGVSVETILRWHRRGELPGFKLPGGAIRFRESDLKEWLEQHATAGDALRGVSPTPDATRRPSILPGSPTPLRGVAARTEED
jgi:excisionase family DNA binding protein